MFYLAYGSNLHPARLQVRAPAARLLGKTVLTGYELHFHKRSVIDDSGKCSISRADKSVHAAVYELSDRDKALLDEVEGFGIGYRYEVLEIAEFGECFTYVATDTHVDDSLRPYSWYKELVLIGCEALQFPKSYIAAVAMVETLEDPDRQRHTEHMRIVHRARHKITARREGRHETPHRNS